jgi:hypothetical protein
VFFLPWAPVALALSLFTQQAPPDASTITTIPSSTAEATRAAPPPVSEQLATPVPPRLVHRPRLAPLIGGAVVFGVTYGLAVFAAWLYTVVSIDDGNDGGSQTWRLLIPLAGPLLAASKGGTGDLPDLGWARYAAWSVLQVAGTASLIYGAVGEDVPSTRRQPRPAVGFAPVFSRTGFGLALNATW